MTPFFELLQIALGTRDHFSHVPTTVEWEEVYEEAGRQAVVGVMFNGIEKLQRLAVRGERLEDCMPPLDLKLEWIGEVMQMEEEYRTHCERAAELTRRFQGVGIESCVLKGVGVAQYYPTPERRQCGDIDLWVREGERLAGRDEQLEGRDERLEVSGERLAVRGERLAGRDERLEVSGERFRERLMNYLRSEYEVGHNVWHHVEAKIFEDVATEIHVHPAWMYGPMHNYHLQRWFKVSEERLAVRGERLVGSDEGGKIQDLGFNVPGGRFDVVFLLVHTFHHLLEEGVGLRHVLDYYFLLEFVKVSDERLAGSGERLAGKEETLSVIRSIGLGKFVGAMMWVLGFMVNGSRFTDDEKVKKEDWMLCEPNEKEGKFLLNEIMAGGNFGQSRQDGKVRNSFSRWWMMVKHYPSEVLWMIPWKVWHRGWKAFHKV